MPVSRRYWDSDVIVSWLLNEAERVEKSQGVAAEAKADRLVLVVSALTLTEVLLYRPEKHIGRENIGIVESFFRQPFIEVVQLTSQIAEEAREFVWDYNIAAKDSIHVATAIHRGVPRMDSFDEKLISRAKPLAKSHGLTVDYPDVPYAPTLEEELSRQEREGA